MLELFPEGFEEIDADGGVELAAYTTAGGEERLWQAFGPGRSDSVRAGWESGWRRFHRPVRVGPLWVGPPWEEAEEDAVAVVVDPGRAFGTGAHPTTRLCLELLAELHRGSLLDAGCGSGVVAIAGAKLGFDPVVALDHELAAVEAARENSAANGVAIDVRRADLLADPLPVADVVVANVSRAVVERLAGRIRAPVLVASGYLVADRPSTRGWRPRASREADGWAADILVRDPA